MGFEIHPVKVGNGFFKNYTYVVVDEATRDAAIIDPAWQMDVITAKLEEIGALPRSVLLTHSHYDHVNLAAAFAQAYSVDVYMNRKEIDRYGFRCPRLRSFDHFDRLRVGGTPVLCLETPGHTAGSTCFQLEGCLFTGDTLFTEGCGICHSDGGCPHAMFRSLQTLKDGVDRSAAVFPGHSFGKTPGKTFDYLLETNIYLNIGHEKKFVDFRMRNVSRSIEKMFKFH